MNNTQRKNLSLASKKRWKDPEYRLKMLARKTRGYTPEHREKLRANFLGANNPLWKEKPCYVSIHEWVSRHKGRPKTCLKCASTDNIEWANRDHKYKRDVEDYIPLCGKCHSLYDHLFNGSRTTLGKNNKSGFKGVSWSKDKNKWSVNITIGILSFHKRYINKDEAILNQKTNYLRLIDEGKKEFMKNFAGKITTSGAEKIPTHL